MQGERKEKSRTGELKNKGGLGSKDREGQEERKGRAKSQTIKEEAKLRKEGIS